MSDDILKKLTAILDERTNADPAESYTAKLLLNGPDSILKKIGEEASETIIASKNGENEPIIHEVADLWFHCLVLLKYHHLEYTDVLKELERRFGLSGIEEKANRKA